MKARRFRAVQLLGAACLASALVGITAGSAWAAGPVCSVGHSAGAEFKTITAALEEAKNTPGSCTTINVAAGKYEERAVVATEGVTLNGAKAGVDARTRGAEADNEATQSIIDNTGVLGDAEAAANNVTINGFTLEGPSGHEPIGVFTGGSSGTQVLDNVVQNNTIGLDVPNGSANQAKVKGNLIRRNTLTGSAGGTGMYVENLSNTVLEDNEFTENPSGGVTIIGSAAGGGTDENITFDDNDLGAEQGMFIAGAKGVKLEGNVTTAGASIDVAGADSNVQINNNVLRNGEMAIVDGNYYNPYASTPAHIGPNSEVSATGNCIEGHSLAGVGMGSFAGTGPTYEEPPFTFYPEPGSPAPHNAMTGPLNAKNNWWGSTSGPTIASNPGGSGDKIIDEAHVVEYKPFATDSTLAGCVVPPPTVTAVSPNTGSAGSIVAVTGTEFIPGTSATKFSFTKTVGRKHRRKTKASKSVNCTSATSCAVLVPRGSGTVDVVATVNGQSSAINPGDQFTY